MDMIVWGIMTWWYTEGWRQRMQHVKLRLALTLDFFSIGLLFSTLFAPFRQISAGNVKGPLDVQIHAFFDRIISRLIGFTVRLMMILAGGVAVVVHLVYGFLLLAVWALIPLLPIIGLVLFLTGWLPWNG